LPFANSALGKAGSKAAIPVLGSLIHHRVEDVKSSAISALGVLGDASLTPLYLDALSDRSWLTKWSAMGAIARQADDRAVGPVADRIRAVLGRDRKTNVGGTTEVMYALEYLDRWRATNDAAAQTIEWVRTTGVRRLQPDELGWFEARFG
jgi:hypothetical protein